MRAYETYSETWVQFEFDLDSGVDVYIFRAMLKRKIESVVVFAQVGETDLVDDTFLEELAAKVLSDHPIEIDYVSWFAVLLGEDDFECYLLHFDFDWNSKEFFNARRVSKHESTVRDYVDKLASRNRFSQYSKVLYQILGY